MDFHFPKNTRNHQRTDISGFSFYEEKTKRSAFQVQKLYKARETADAVYFFLPSKYSPRPSFNQYKIYFHLPNDHSSDQRYQLSRTVNDYDKASELCERMKNCNFHLRFICSAPLDFLLLSFSLYFTVLFCAIKAWFSCRRKLLIYAVIFLIKCCYTVLFCFCIIVSGSFCFLGNWEHFNIK